MVKGEEHSHVRRIPTFFKSNLIFQISSAFKGLVSQSTRAHRISRKAYQLGGQNKQLPFLCAVFRAYLEEGKDVADVDVLSDICEQTGVMSKQEVRPRS